MSRGGIGARRDMTTDPEPLAVPRSATRLVAAVSLLLCLVTTAIYAQTYRHGFVAYDDDAYVYENGVVKQGLTWQGVVWAFTTFHAANWHPLTWLSHMLDWQLFGGNAGAQHLANLAFHLANVVLLLAALVKMTGSVWRSAAVAAVFAVHPLHVESVAWIAERKDVLSTFFVLIALLFYTRYAKAPSLRRYAPVLVAFSMAAMSKPMVVTFPAVLVLLDAWPVGRLAWPVPRGRAARILLEKLPLMAVAAAVSALTVMAQRSGGALESLSDVPLLDRLENAVTTYFSYILQAFWPSRLAVLYPIERPVALYAALSLAAIGAVTALALMKARTKPYILVGWLWYLGMLAPVIGLVQVGSQAMADRYTYFPLAGLSIALVWMVADWVARGRARIVAAPAACAMVLAFAVAAHGQAAYWQSSKCLFERALAVTENNFIMDNNLGVVLGAEGRSENAMALYRRALALKEDYPEAHTNLGHELLKAGRLDEAWPHLARAIEIRPAFASAHADLAVALLKEGRLRDAQCHLEECLKLTPANSTAHVNLSFVFLQFGRFDDAIAQCREALRLCPNSVDAHYNIAVAFAKEKNWPAAISHLSAVLALDPQHEGARRELAQLQQGQQKREGGGTSGGLPF